MFHIFFKFHFSALIDVDSNMINFERLPKVDLLYASSFAGGASGYPMMFEKLQPKLKRKYYKKIFFKKKKEDIRKVKAEILIPYASFFT